MKHALLDYLVDYIGLKNDAQLADYFEYRQAVISKIRNRRMAISSNVILIIHEKLDIPVVEIRRLINESEKEYKRHDFE